jgi:uncharacterized SAM-binding protein YcdF (DUF218 family)
MTTRPATRISRLTIFVAIVFLCTAGASGQERNPPAGIPANKINSPERVIGVIALGGTAERTREAGRLARQFPHLRVIVSGAETAPSLKQLGQGISRDRIQIETASRNTHENATNAVSLIKPRSGDRWLLVTSNWHMRRALCAFRTAGFDVEPWPVVDRAMGQQKREHYVSRERFALAAYRLAGWCKE